jgi:hypothetical protein
MSIELQIQSAVLGSLTARVVQARLMATCFAPIGTAYIDHADVSTTPVQLFAANAAVRLQVPIDVFVVRADDVLAAPNATPVGATVPAGTVVVVLEMAATGAAVSLTCVDADLGPLGVSLGLGAAGAKAAIIDAVGSPMTLDLTQTLRQLGMPAPGSSRVELAGSAVTIRFDPIGNAASHLLPGQEWGMFLDGVSAEQLALSRVPDELRSRIPVSAHWRPVGAKPHVDVDYAGKIAVPDPFSASVDGVLGCDFALMSAAAPSLRTTVHWSLHINLGPLVPGFIDEFAEALVAGMMDPASFGGTPIDGHTFSVDSPLPNVSFGGALLGYASVGASPAGMTIGGPVRLPLDLGKDTLQPSVHEFGLPFRLTFCRTLAKSGSGAPSKTVSLGEATTNGSVWLENLGAFCDIELVSPGDWIAPYVRRPAETPEIRIVVPSAVALGITQPVRFIVRTARGVRLIDLGTPPPAIVTNALTSHIPNCLFIRVEHGIDWGIGVSGLTPPLELPDWATYLARQRGVDVQLVTLSSLEPGELIQFRSRDHAMDVTADRSGRAVLPVLLPIADTLELASLTRVNRRSIAGHFTTTTALFVSQASLPSGVQHRLVSSTGGTAVLTTEFENHVDVHEIGQLGAPTLVRRDRRHTGAPGGHVSQADAGALEVSSGVHCRASLTARRLGPRLHTRGVL